jgi:3-deoxy-D-manno-octulosonic-acid transferase
MGYFLDVVYLALLAILSPWLAYKSWATGKYRRGLAAKFFGHIHHPSLPTTGPIVWFHGVSVGEIHLLRQVIAACRKRHPDWRLVISTTTDTGFDEATRIFADLPVIYWPLDFSWAVARALDTVRPDLVVIAESELWPNFLRAARRRRIPVAVINGRMSPRSAARFAKLSWLTRPMFASVDVFAAQTDEYAEHYRCLGARRVVVTGSVKYDGAAGDRLAPKTQELRLLFRIADDALIWVAGSTQTPEEEICLDLYRRALAKHPKLRLILVPRQKDRFDEVANLLERSGVPFARRSRIDAPIDAPVILVDTIGELGAIWGLADLAFVGGSLDGKRGGQNMIEPAAYGAAVVFGPHTWNFKETVKRLLEKSAAIQVADAAELEATVDRLLSDAPLRGRLGNAARSFVRSQQGATERTLDVLAGLLRSESASRAA